MVADVPRGDLAVRGGNDGRRDLLAEGGMRNGKHADLAHRGMLSQDGLYFERSDLLAAAIDQILDPTGDRQVAVVIESADIAGSEPPIDKRRGGRVRVIPVAIGHRGSPGDDLTITVGSEKDTVLVDNAHFVARGYADRTGLAYGRWQWIVGQVARLRHAVPLDDRCAERGLETADDLRVEAARSGADEA